MGFQNAEASRIGRGLLVAVIVAGFVFCGVRGFRSVPSRRIDGTGPLGSTDSFLWQATQVHGSAARILDSLAGLPAAAPLAIVAPYDNIFGSILLPTIAEITWPRDVYLVQVGTGDFRQKMEVLRKYHFGGAIYYGIQPPATTANTQRLGPMTIVPAPQ